MSNASARTDAPAALSAERKSGDIGDLRCPATKNFMSKPESAADWIERAAKLVHEIANLLPGTLDGVGGGTLVAPTIKVQLVKDARELMSPNAKVSDRADEDGRP